MSGPSWSTWLEEPLSAWGCIAGWLGATAVFVALTAAFDGPTYGDTPITILSTWAIAHGALACAYPPAHTYQFALAAPLYPLLSGGIAALLRIGHSVPFPHLLQHGTSCTGAFLAIDRWSDRSGAWLPTMRIAYVSWVILMAGAVSMLRACGRGRRGWEPAALVLLALTTPILLCLVEWFHPQDVVAVGLAMCGVASARRGSWIWVGVFLGLAYVSQPFAGLVAAALFVAAPRARRFALLAGFVSAAALIAVPFVVTSSGRALRSILIGSNRVGVTTKSVGGTVLWELNLHGVVLFLASRAAPLAATIVIAFWLQRRLGSALLNPVPLTSLVVLSFLSRLVFEVNFFGYYLMAVAVSLVLLDIVNGHIRGSLVAWIALCTVAYNPVQWAIHANGVTSGLAAYRAVPIAMVVLAAMAAFVLALRGVFRWYLIAWIGFVTTALLLGGWRRSPYGHPFPIWLWQVVLVSTAAVLAAGPLISVWNQRGPSLVARPDTTDMA